VTWLAVVWEPDAAEIAARADAVVCDALEDQGRFSVGDPFGCLVVADGPDPAPIAPRLGARVWAWEVATRVLRASPTPCPLTMVALTRRRASLTPAEFARHWHDRHGPLALRHHAGLADYRQAVVTRPVTPGGAGVDGIARLGFASRADFETRFYDSEDGKQVIRTDVERFLAPPGGTTTLVGPPRAVATAR